MFVNDQIKIELNGKKQFVSIRAEKEGLPLLLYLRYQSSCKKQRLFLRKIEL